MAVFRSPVICTLIAIRLIFSNNLCNLLAFEYTSNHCLCIGFFAAQVVLTSSVGMGGACPNEMVTYTCAVTQGTTLNWTAVPHIPDNSLTVYSPIPLMSNLSFTVTSSLNGTVVYCRGANGNDSSTLNVAGTLCHNTFIKLTNDYATEYEQCEVLELIASSQSGKYSTAECAIAFAVCVA